MCPRKPYCKKFIYKPYLERIKYLVRLPNHKKINELALIGTHSSFSYDVNDEKSKTQDMNIQQQLKYGVRVFDIGIRSKSNSFEIYSNDVATNINFEDALLYIDNFLDNNPGEFIILFIRQVYLLRYEITQQNCHILNFYKRNFVSGRRLVKNWQLTDTIGQHRGKILLASLDYSFYDCTLILRRKCLLQNDDVIYENKKLLHNLTAKWISVYKTIQASYSENYECYINDISFWDGINSPRIIARDGDYKEDKNRCPIPLNYMMAQFFENPHFKLTIVMADFPPQELIDKVNDGNFPNSSWRSGWE
ncbi:uncharacterized protein LOC103568655 [Microplitis demolitor]|uniref:uncharacterized protein LOC103568655 n=1 Tax=Microplitis demolitor TaxID=69319 RepID=UPI000440024C|nr:uncharacterized protein LOC103568655 [Microplitis demolitor]